MIVYSSHLYTHVVSESFFQAFLSFYNKFNYDSIEMRKSLKNYEDFLDYCGGKCISLLYLHPQHTYHRVITTHTLSS